VLLLCVGDHADKGPLYRCDAVWLITRSPCESILTALRFGYFLGSKLHVDMSATTREALPTGGEPAARGRVNHSRGTPRQPRLPPK